MDGVTEAVKEVLVARDTAMGVGAEGQHVNLDCVLFEWLQSVDINTKLILLRTYSEWHNNIPRELRAVVYGILTSTLNERNAHKVS